LDIEAEAPVPRRKFLVRRKRLIDGSPSGVTPNLRHHPESILLASPDDRGGIAAMGSDEPVVENSTMRRLQDCVGSLDRLLWIANLSLMPPSVRLLRYLA
jgi:hypothetical protein